MPLAESVPARSAIGERVPSVKPPHLFNLTADAPNDEVPLALRCWVLISIVPLFLPYS